MIPGNIELLQQLMDNMTDNIFFKDLKTRFIMMNQSCARWNGFKTPQEAVGKSDADLFTEEFAAAAKADEQQVHETGEPMRCKEEHAEWEDGHMKWVSTSKVPLRDTDGNIVGCIGIGRDITDLKRKESELIEATRKLRKANDQIAEDLQMAAGLQQTFLPRNYPVFSDNSEQPIIDFHHYYKAFSEIGGDYCAITKLDAHRAGLLICDAMGHGVRAALITGIIRAISDNLFQSAPSAGDFLTALNRHLFPMLQSQDAFLFVTACCCIIDVRTGELTGALAGHPAPYRIDSATKTAAFLPIGNTTLGPALAITDDHEYETFAIQLNPGDTILLYTDGICEAANADGEEFGSTHLQEVLQQNGNLPLPQLFACLVQAARNHAGNHVLDDDLCLLGASLHALLN